MMDTKNDDSAGSDSLDKSLQKKCVVDDMAVDQAAQSVEECIAQATSSIAASTTVATAAGHGNSTHNKKQKTEKHALKEQTTTTTSAAAETGNSRFMIQANAHEQHHEHVSAHNSLQAATTASTANMSSAANAINCNSNNSEDGAASCSSSNSNNTFETKVKQISKNLKETTLAEPIAADSSNNDDGNKSNQNNTTTTLDNADNASTSSNSSSTSSSYTASSEYGGGETAASSSSSSASSQSSTHSDNSQAHEPANNESMEDGESRSKKVRFHPDVKENDGGNRVIPKKKKKLKSSAGNDEASSSGGQQRTDGDEMDLDDEDGSQEEEEEFDLEKTIAEAQDYLKEHPLTFVRTEDKQEGRLQNGLLEEEDLSQLSDSSEDDDDYEFLRPEVGIERILGKQIRGDKIEYMLRFAHQPGLFWESEDFIFKHCPRLLSAYEKHRDKRQARLMRHVARRQNLRQRYTDF